MTWRSWATRQIRPPCCDDGWFPENVDFGLCVTPEEGGETVAVVLDEEALASFRDEVRKAEKELRETIELPGCPKPVPVKWAAEALASIEGARAEVSRREFDPQKSATQPKVTERKGLVPAWPALDAPPDPGIRAHLVDAHLRQPERLREGAHAQVGHRHRPGADDERGDVPGDVIDQACFE